MSFDKSELDEFKSEVIELIDSAEKSLLALDQGADFRTCFNTIFRGFHNLKSASAIMEMTGLEMHSHELENILMEFKDKDSMPKEFISFFLKGIDAARLLLSGEEVSFDYTIRGTLSPEAQVPSNPGLSESAIDEFVAECEEVIERLSKDLRALEQDSSNGAIVDQVYRDVHSLKGSAYLFSYKKLGDVSHAMESSLEKVRNGSHLASRELFDALFESIKLVESLVRKIKEKKPDDELAFALKKIVQNLVLAEETLSPADAKPTKVEMSVASLVTAPAPESVEPTKVETSTAPPPHGAPPPMSNKDKDTEGAATSIRVPISVLDSLMTLMGEMVLVRNQVLQFSNTTENLEFLSLSKRLNVVTSEIQNEMMKTRLQPIGNLLNKFHRVVRDLSQELNKNIQLEVIGAETELDKSLLEAIKDPLTHIVRNSCDHGIETQDVRKSLGKPSLGTLKIHAYHEGGQVIIEVEDDGKGLNRDVLLRKSIEKGLITKSQADLMTEKEAYQMIFAPGFSTAEKVTNVSGRGVGMDVVRTNIERIGGNIDLASVSGKGTTIKLKIPLTLAIVPALIIRSGGETFAIPQVKLEELVRVAPEAEDQGIEMLHNSPVFRLRGNILPLVDLNKILGKASSESYKDRTINIAVLNADQSLFGIIFDEVMDTADIVVKPLNRLLKSLQVYSGGTILGDGSVALILDVLGISKVAQLANSKVKSQQAEADNKLGRAHMDAQDYLLLKLKNSTKHAIVLGYVHRLEEFKKEQVELFVAVSHRLETSSFPRLS